MKRGVLFPYQTLEGEVNLRVSAPPGVPFSEQERTIDFRAEASGKRPFISSTLRVDVPDMEIEALPYRGPRVHAVVRCGATDMRRAVALSSDPDNPSCWTGQLELARDELRGEVSITAVVTAFVEDDFAPRMLAETEPWTILVDDSASRSLRGELPIFWRDFSEYPDLKPYMDEPFHVDMDQALPTVYLNQRIDGLAEILPKEGYPSGALRSLYETVRTGIARSVWLALLEASLAGIASPDDENEGDMPTWPTVAWQKDVLVRILPHVFQEAEDVEMLRLALRARREEAEARQLSSRAVLVVEKELVRDGTSLRRALKSINDYLEDTARE